MALKKVLRLALGMAVAASIVLVLFAGLRLVRYEYVPISDGNTTVGIIRIDRLTGGTCFAMSLEPMEVIVQEFYLEHRPGDYDDEPLGPCYRI